MSETTKPLVCAGCTKCCHGELILLHPEKGDDPRKYQTVETVNPINGEPALAIEPTGTDACRYLGEAGCAIYSDRPVICRAFDCSMMALGLMNLERHERKRRLKAGIYTRDMIETGIAKARERGMCS